MNCNDCDMICVTIHARCSEGELQHDMMGLTLRSEGLTLLVNFSHETEDKLSQLNKFVIRTMKNAKITDNLTITQKKRELTRIRIGQVRRVCSNNKTNTQASDIDTPRKYIDIQLHSSYTESK